MAVFEGTVFSKCLRLMTSLTVSVPPSPEGEMPVLYLLHGSLDNHSCWLRRTNIDRYAEEAGIAVVMPEVQRSFYIDMAYGLPYFTYIAQELPDLCRRMFHFSEKREHSFIAGSSMGGYGALKIALRCPDRFAAAGSFSGAPDIRKWLPHSDDPLEVNEAFAIHGGELSPQDDLFHLSEEAAREKRAVPRLYITCGLSDFLYEDNRRFREHLDALELPYTYEEWPGAHEWGFWDESARRAVGLFSRMLKE